MSGGGQTPWDDQGIRRCDLDEVKRRTSLVALVGRSVALKKIGKEYWGVCPFHTEKTPSFSVREDKGFYHCFGCGAHGNAIDWMMTRHGMGFREAVEDLAVAAGMQPDRAGRTRPKAREIKRPTPAQEAQSARFRGHAAREMWDAALPLTGTLGEVYLRKRLARPAGWIPLPPTLRFAPALKHPSGAVAPCMLAAVWDGQRRLLTVHRHFLAPDGDKFPNPPRKLALSAYKGGAIRLTRPARRLAIGEGVETCLSVLLACTAEPEAGPMLRGEPLAIWSGVSQSNIAGCGLGPSTPHPDFPPDARKMVPSPVPDPADPGLDLPDWAEEILLLPDADSDRATAVALMTRAAARYGRQRRVTAAWPDDGMDFNDMVVGDMVVVAPGTGA